MSELCIWKYFYKKWRNNWSEIIDVDEEWQWYWLTSHWSEHKAPFFCTQVKQDSSGKAKDPSKLRTNNNKEITFQSHTFLHYKLQLKLLNNLENVFIKLQLSTIFTSLLFTKILNFWQFRSRKDILIMGHFRNVVLGS